jgi:hypothetical protein
MRYRKWLAAAAAIIITMPLASSSARASGLDGGATALTALQAKADQAPTRDQCFLYAELVSQLAELAGQQLNSGDSGQASETLKLLRQYTEKIDPAIADDSRKLKDAELLTRRASFRLKNILRNASYEDRPALDATLKFVYQAQTHLMIQVFKK